MAAIRVLTTSGPAFDVLTYIVLLPVIAYLSFAFGVLTVVACSVLIYTLTAIDSGGSQLGALTAP
ncbi:MAG: putative membrane protein YqhA [Myxococcota bacterium]|jgi:uncharacterized membrane protein YqhA